MRPTFRTLPIAVIGGGFSGMMAAEQLLRALPPDRAVVLCERGHPFGLGLAYSTPNPDHLLNLRATQMSADPEQPGAFSDWLVRAELDPTERLGLRETEAGTFASRGLYGRYLSERWTRLAEAAGDRLVADRAAIVDVEPVPEGFVLHGEGVSPRRVAGLVLAMGNLPGPAITPSRHRLDPWRPEAFGALYPGRDVLVVGTGLTMMDSVAALRREGFAGRVVAVSRRGLLPKPHAAVPVGRRPDFSPEIRFTPEIRASARRLFAAVRREVAAAREAGADWRGVIDALRPITDSLWTGLPRAEQARILRHVRPYWDVHRHRTAPPAAEAIADEIRRGSLVVRAARILAIDDAPDRALVTIRPRGTDDRERIEAQGILDATGFSRLAETGDPLIRNLLARGLVRPGPFGLGIAAGPDGRVAGQPTDAPVWAFGPMLRGVIWECIAVPDIRDAARPLARAVADRLGDRLAA
ncbi:MULTISPECIES: FAD/NAD(P)-binding protein [Methylobacterium]|uniref:FAD/NAD(P)-binding protein n=1 Tax=Methylobacterium TaxID=407 RepID=UPI000B08FEB6|nr:MULTISPECIES: FAD/NAD(P)-binding protein [Methylobacterium]